MISIIIPTLNEEKTIGACLKQIERQTGPQEVIVVDGGSRDSTEAVVRSFPQVRWLQASAKGRGRQMNRGAKAAKGDILLFLHADTHLPPDGLPMITACMQPADVVAGSFSLCFDHPNALLRLFARLSRINHVLFTYGDQGFFCTRQVFEELGGFRKRFLMEDVDFVKNSRKLGKLLVVPHRMRSSSQRYLTKGILRASLLNHLLVFLYFLGVNDKKLYARYYNGT